MLLVACVGAAGIVVGTGWLTFGLLKMSPGASLHIKVLHAALAHCADSWVAAVWQQQLLLIIWLWELVSYLHLIGTLQSLWMAAQSLSSRCGFSQSGLGVLTCQQVC